MVHELTSCDFSAGSADSRYLEIFDSVDITNSDNHVGNSDTAFNPSTDLYTNPADILAIEVPSQETSLAIYDTSNALSCLSTQLSLQEAFDHGDTASRSNLPNSTTSHHKTCKRLLVNNNEWLERKEELYFLYMEIGYSCGKTMEKMAKKGFHAEYSGYRKKFAEWGWYKYKSRALCSRGVRKLPLESQAAFKMPPAIRSTNIQTHYRAAVKNSEELYLHYFKQSIWNLDIMSFSARDAHKDLARKVLHGLHELGNSDLPAGFDSLRNAFVLLEAIVENENVGDCGLFTLPAIFQAYSFMTQHGRLDLASSFLKRATRLATIKLGQDHAFVKILSSLCSLEKEVPQQISHAISVVRQNCITHVLEQLGFDPITARALWSTFGTHVSSARGTELASKFDPLQFIEKSDLETMINRTDIHNLETVAKTLHFLLNLGSLEPHVFKTINVVLNCEIRNEKGVRIPFGNWCLDKLSVVRVVRKLSEHLQHDTNVSKRTGDHSLSLIWSIEASQSRQSL